MEKRTERKNHREAQRKARKAILTVDQKAARLGMSKGQFITHRGLRNLQVFVDGVGFNTCVAILIIVSVVLIFAEFLLEPGPQQEKVIYFNDVVTWIFVVELSLRYIVAPSKRTYFSNYWIDILAVLPVLRVFRTLRLIRLLRLLRLTRAVMILLRTSGWLSARLERYFGSLGVLLVTAIMLVICGTLAMLTQVDSGGTAGGPVGIFVDKVWLTTFLFVSGEPIGEIPPTTTGRLVAVLVSVAGLVVFAILVGTISASMSTYFRTKMEEKDLGIEDLREHILICGWDRMGSLILSELETVSELWLRGVVVVSQTDSNIVADSRVKNPRRLFHVKEDFTKMDVLKRVGAKNAKAAIVLADKGDNLGDQDRDARTVLAALTLEKINPQIFTCAELLDEVNATHLRIAGVEEIISRTKLTAGLFSSTLINRGISSVITDLLTHKEGTYLRKFELPDQFVGRSFIEVFDHFKKEFDATILGIDWHDDEGAFHHSVNPPSARRMRTGDFLIVVAGVESAFRELTG